MGNLCDILWEIYRPDYVTWFFQFDSVEMEKRRDGKLISHRRGEKKGVKRATPFCKIWREKRSGRCILLQLYGEIDYKEESIHYRGN